MPWWKQPQRSYFGARLKAWRMFEKPLSWFWFTQFSKRTKTTKLDLKINALKEKSWNQHLGPHQLWNNRCRLLLATVTSKFLERPFGSFVQQPTPGIDWIFLNRPSLFCRFNHIFLNYWLVIKWLNAHFT